MLLGAGVLDQPPYHEIIPFGSVLMVSISYSLNSTLPRLVLLFESPITLSSESLNPESGSTHRVDYIIGPRPMKLANKKYNLALSVGIKRWELARGKQVRREKCRRFGNKPFQIP